MKAGDYRDVALEAKDSAIGVWQARYMDISRQHDDATAEVVRLAAKLRVEEKARRFFQAKIEAALAKVEGVCSCEEWLKPPCLSCEIRKALRG